LDISNNNFQKKIKCVSNMLRVNQTLKVLDLTDNYIDINNPYFLDALKANNSLTHFKYGGNTKKKMYISPQVINEISNLPERNKTRN